MSKERRDHLSKACGGASAFCYTGLIRFTYARCDECCILGRTEREETSTFPERVEGREGSQRGGLMVAFPTKQGQEVADSSGKRFSMPL